MQILCSGTGPHEPQDGVIGEADRPVDGMLCSACAAAMPTEVESPPLTVEERLAAIEEVQSFLLLSELEV